MLVITIPKALRDKLGEDASEGLIHLVNEATGDARDNIILMAEEKFEKRLTEETAKLDKRITDETAKLDKRITEETAKLDKRITDETAKLDKRITEEVAKLRVEIGAIRTDMASFKAEIIKWMFLFWVGQLVIIAGLLKFIR